MALIKCQECSKDISDEARYCPHCGVPLQHTTLDNIEIPDIQLWLAVALGLFGCGIIALGVFLPFITIGPWGSVNLFNNAEGDGLIILVLTAISALTLIFQRFTAPAFSWFLASLVYVWDLVYAINRIQDVKTEMTRGLTDNPFRGLAESMAATIHIDYGAYIIGIGCLVLLGAIIWGSRLDLLRRKLQPELRYWNAWRITAAILMILCLPIVIYYLMNKPSDMNIQSRMQSRNNYYGQSPPSSPQIYEPTSRISVKNFDFRTSTDNPYMWSFSWKVDLENSGSRSSEVTLEIEYLDEDGFSVSKDYEFGCEVPAYSTKTITGISYMSAKEGKKVKRAIARINR